MQFGSSSKVLLKKDKMTKLREKSIQNMSVSTETKSIGRITQIIGPVLDVSFPPGKMPNIYNALAVRGKNEARQEISVTCEVQQ